MHELQSTTNQLRGQVEQYQRRVHDLEEQIESDDRAERLEVELQHTQDRAAELEFQVSKLQQVRIPTARNDTVANCSQGSRHYEDRTR